MLTTHIHKVLAKPINPGEVLWDTKDHRGMTLSSFTTVTLTPDPIVSFNIKEPSKTLDSLRKQPHFLIHILKQTPQGVGVAEAFAKGNGDEKSLGHAFTTPAGKSSAWNYGHMWSIPGQPRLPHLTSPGVLRTLHCEVLSEEDAAVAGCGSGFIQVGHHTLVLAKVHDIWKSLDMGRIVRSKEPTLCYQHGGFVVADPKKPIPENLTTAQLLIASKHEDSAQTTDSQMSEQVSKKKIRTKEKSPSVSDIKRDPQKSEQMAVKKGARAKRSSLALEEDTASPQSSELVAKKKKGGIAQNSISASIAPLKIRTVGPRINQPLESRTARVLEKMERIIRGLDQSADTDAERDERRNRKSKTTVAELRQGREMSAERNMKGSPTPEHEVPKLHAEGSFDLGIKWSEGMHKEKRDRKRNLNVASKSIDLNDLGPSSEPLTSPTPVSAVNTEMDVMEKWARADSDHHDHEPPHQAEQRYSYKPVEPKVRPANADFPRDEGKELQIPSNQSSSPAPGSVEDLSAKFLEKWAKKARAASTDTVGENEAQAQPEQLHSYTPPESEKMDSSEERAAEDRNQRLEPNLKHRSSYPPPRPHGRRLRRPADDLEQW